ncbi:MAG: Hydroxyacylglutathione hydrolase [Chroococcopsis gigantea SAG 12.99]|jgi:uncharacterized NAD(P)/FAD-binding protein YdhS/glyoxylase-like metal-dependent hydrolase (beta-lactamase superfamily II)|nr:FAD/NAD(P)-binding protein [Chlorogloea purpurea SAG 13.99]MDV2999345.1 Hydroxyacylglutathione hydrolase [Chroococcopsis gigantea SAG 12.99]
MNNINQYQSIPSKTAGQINHYDIVIIGGGCAGSLVTANLLRDTTTSLSIALVERRKKLGRGVAYGTRDIKHLLNVPAGKMSAFEDDPDHFSRWLPANGYSGFDGSTFVPRLVYGQYIRSLLEDVLDNNIAGHHLDMIGDEAVSISIERGNAYICLKDGRTLVASKVVLAPGNFPAATPEPLASLNSPYIRDAWEPTAVGDLDRDDTLLLVGTGLTMVDVLVSLHQKGFKGKIHAISRHGLTPIRHQNSPSYPCFLDLETAPRTTRKLLRRVRMEVNLAAERGYDWRVVLNALRPITQSLWQSLPLGERRRFSRHLKPYWENLRHRIPDEMGAILDEAVSSGQLIYHAGRIKSCREVEGGIEVVIRKRKTQSYSLVSAGRLINCTGTNTNYLTLADPLIISLREAGLISPHPSGCGIETVGSGEVVNRAGDVDGVLYTLGTPRKGDLWETTAVPEIRLQAAQLALAFLQWGRTRSIVPRTQGQILELSPRCGIFRQLFDKESSTYTYLIADTDAGEGILIDPVLEQVERDLRILRELGLTLRLTMETHLHADHVTGAHRLRELTDCSILFPEKTGVKGSDGYVRDGDIYYLGGQKIQAIATPGHTDSHMAYLIDEERLLTGDALLIRSCGRTDFQSGSAEVLFETVTEKLFTLPDQTLVYPCHDYAGRTFSSIGEEKRWNPRFVGQDRQSFIKLMKELNLPYPKKIVQALSANSRGGQVSFVIDYQI